MVRWVWRPGKRTVLRLRDRGLPVAWLQGRLQSLGYRVGPIDGVYDFLTEDCICSLQRQYGLKVDGIAGPQVMELLRDSQLQAGSVLQAVWGVIQGDAPIKVKRRLSEGLYSRLTGLFLHCFSIEEAGNIVGGIPEVIYSLAESTQVRLVPVISNLQHDIYDELALEALLRHRHARGRLLDMVKRIVADPKIDGVALDFQKVAIGYGRRFTALVEGARKLAADYHKSMYMVLVPNDGHREALSKHVDNRLWASLPDRVILRASLEHVSGTPGPKMGLQWVQNQLTRVYRYLPAWKLMVILPVDGIAWRVDGNLREYKYLSYDDARRLAYQHQAKIRWDMVEKVPFYDFMGDEGRCRVWYENSDSIRPKLEWLNRQPLTGIVIEPMGGEDFRIWEKVDKTYRVQGMGDQTRSGNIYRDSHRCPGI
ncbi:MAG: hypothetical protein GX977_08680 [Firmicutes bacterium]|nr:hypothetical protein [Bacillota bacterium]